MPNADPHDIYHPNNYHFGGKIKEMIADMPEWKQKLLKYFPPQQELYKDPAIEFFHPDNDLETVVRKAAESFYGMKLEEEEPKAQKFEDPADVDAPNQIAPPDTDAPPVKPVHAQTEDDEEDNMVWMAVGGISVGAALVWIFSTKRRPLSMDSGEVNPNAGYARLPEKRTAAGATTDSESSGADQGSRSTGSHSNAGPHSDIYASIRRSLQDQDPSTVWKSVRASFVTSDTGSASAQPSDAHGSSKQQYAAETSSVSHTDSEEEITEVYDRVKKSLKNLNLLPRKSQEVTKDMPPSGGASGSSFR